jgi:hypothetical protein
MLKDKYGFKYKTECGEDFTQDVSAPQSSFSVSKNFIITFFPVISENLIYYVNKNGIVEYTPLPFNFSVTGGVIKCKLIDKFPVRLVTYLSGQVSIFGDRFAKVTGKLDEIRNNIDKDFVKDYVAIPIMADSLANVSNLGISFRDYPQEQQFVDLQAASNVFPAIQIQNRFLLSILTPFFLQHFDKLLDGTFFERKDCNNLTVVDYIGRSAYWYAMRILLMAYNDPFFRLEAFFGYPMDLLYQDWDYSTCDVRGSEILESNYKRIAGALKAFEEQGYVKRNLDIFKARKTDKPTQTTGTYRPGFYSNLQLDKWSDFKKPIKPTTDQLNRYYSQWKPNTTEAIKSFIKTNYVYIIVLIIALVLIVYLIRKK